MELTITSITVIINGIFCFFIALVLTRLGMQKQARSLLWLAAFFYFTTLANLSVSIPGLAMPLNFFRFLMLVIFIHKTFYNNRRSPAIFIGALVTLLTITAFALLPGNSAILPGILVSNAILIADLFPGLLIWGWHWIAAIQAYRAIAADKYVEDWIKSRYQMMLVYILFMFIPVIGFSLHPAIESISPYWMVVPLASSLIGTILQALTWIMPEFLCKWLNRNYKAPLVMDLKNLSEDSIGWNK